MLTAAIILYMRKTNKRYNSAYSQPTSKDVAVGFLEKAKPNLPQKPAKAPAPSKASSAKPAAAKAAPPAAAPALSAAWGDDDEAEEPEKPPASAPAKTAPAGRGRGKVAAKKVAFNKILYCHGRVGLQMAELFN